MTMSLIVVDTDVLSYIIKDDPLSDEYLEILAGAENVILSFATVTEIRVGMYLGNWGPKRRSSVEEFLAEFPIYDTDDSLTDRYARLLSEQKKRGITMQSGDCWVASTALELTCPVVTNNRKHFEQIEGLEVITAGRKVLA